jgi:hypothetical protein
MVGKNEAQAQPYYGGGGMDSYGSSNYGNDNSYGQSQYQPSYKPDYKPQYPSYGKDDNRDKSKDIKNIDINKLKCINNNININGNNTGNINIGNKGAANAEEGYVGAYSSGSGSGYGGSGGYDGYKKDKGFDCIINNNNTNINGGGNQTIPPVPPEQKTTLNVTKTVVCNDEEDNDFASIQQLNGPVIEDCDDLEAIVEPSNFNITVTGNNPVPSSFLGSELGTGVQIGPDGYTVTEDPDAEVDAVLATGNATLTTTFEGGCAPLGSGTIVAGVPQTCNIINNFTIVEKTTLTVTKTVDCVDEEDNDVASIQQFNPVIEDCDDLEDIVEPSNFNITVAGNNPIPSSFLGSATGTGVQIGPDGYTVTEDQDLFVDAVLATGNATLTTTFEGDCAPLGSGTIVAGVPQTCNIINNFTIVDIGGCIDCWINGLNNNGLGQTVFDQVNAFLANNPQTITIQGISESVSSLEEACAFIFANLPPGTADSLSQLQTAVAAILTPAGVPNSGGLYNNIAQCFDQLINQGGAINQEDIAPFDIHSGGIEDSPTVAQETQLSAVEKMTKLKQQWLGLLP